VSGDVTAEQKADPAFAPTPQFWERLINGFGCAEMAA
jgi:hypothetical protein